MKFPWISVCLLLSVTAVCVAQEPLLPLADYEKQSVTAAIEAEVSTVEELLLDPDIPRETRRQLNQYMDRLRAASAQVNALPDDEFPSEIMTIVQGTKSAVYPSVGALLYGGQTVCSGTLIGSAAILTARHCFDASSEPGRFNVYFQHALIRAVSEIHFPKDKNLDLAVLCLEDPVVNISSSSFPAALTAEGQNRKIVGFGATYPTGSDSGIKRHGSIETVTCTPESANHLCWIYDPLAEMSDPGANACGRDSGGPVGVASGADLQFEDGVISNVLPIQACATTSKASSVAVVPNTVWLDSTALPCGSNTKADVLPCCGGAVEVWVQDDMLPADSIHSKVWSFKVPEDTRLVSITMNAFDLGGTSLELEILAPQTLPAGSKCIDLGRYVSCEYRYDGAPPDDWIVTVTNPGNTTLPYQIVVTLYPENNERS